MSAFLTRVSLITLNIAEVDEYGWVTSTGVGTAIITAQYKGVSAECVVDVERKITSDTRGE